MERAGLAIAQFTHERTDLERRILVLAGPGHNGGDALVAAAELTELNHAVDLLCWGAETRSDTARVAYEQFLANGGRLLTALPRYANWQMAIDGLFGIGLNRPLQGDWLSLIARINTCDLPVLAIDLPSGLCSDTGQILGAAIQANWTLSFIGLKPGLFTLHGRDHAGEIYLDTLGLTSEDLAGANAQLVNQMPATIARLRRPRHAHKGMFGDVGVIGGGLGMVGAPLLAGRAALLLGAGRVWVSALAAGAPAYDPLMPELMFAPVDQLLEPDKLAALVLGPGLGTEDVAVEALRQALAGAGPLVLDADALNLLAAHKPLARQLTKRRAPAILTPHPLEAARLLGCDTGTIQADRLQATAELVKRYKACVVLKGAGSIVSDGKQTYLNASGSPALSSPGQGDVLAGMIAALLAQGLSAIEAAQLGVYLHGRAGDVAEQAGTGPIGHTASETAQFARRLLNQAVLAL